MEKPEYQETIEYFMSQMKPIFSTLMEQLIKQKPEDINDYCLNWFKNKRQESDDHSDEEDAYDNEIQVLPDEVFRKLREQKLAKARPRRIGFSSETYGHTGKRISIKITKGYKKEQNAHMNILFFCMNNFLFRNFNEKQVNELITMMGQKKTVQNEIIFEQGDPGNQIYFVYEGIFECYKRNQQEEIQSLRYYHKGDTFGQICLLHVINRQASIISRGDGILFTLDRQSYIHYKKMCIIRLRNRYIQTLRRQYLFKNFSEDQLQKVCDVLVQVSYDQYEVVINQGDVGKKFYIIIEGILVAYKGKQQNVIQCYKEGDAFGEIALIKEVPRQASVKALTRCTLVYLSSETFSRIFENIDLKKEIDDKYFSNKNNGLLNVHKRRE